MKIKGIVFDKDGTLIDYESFWVERTRAATRALLSRHGAMDAYLPIMKRMGIREDGTVDIDGALCHSTYAEISVDYSIEIENLGISVDREELLSELRADFSEYRSLAVAVPTSEGIKELLSWLKGRGVKLGLVTSDDADGVAESLGKMDILPLFDIVLTSDGIHPTKPDPYYMNLFCDRMGLSPTEVLMVGDTYADMLFGKNAGAFTLGVSKDPSNREKLSALADFTAPDLLFIKEMQEMTRLYF